MDSLISQKEYTSFSKYLRWQNPLPSGGSREFVKPVAFYLPQFYPTPYNDIWYGKGFTEWDNVRSAKPLFKGHYQPRVPADLGYYNIKDPGLMEAQASLASSHGIYGFCIYYYLLEGRRLLEWPLERIASDPDWSFPFCVAWANESWKRKWYSSSEDLLARQTYTADEMEKVASDFSRYFSHPAYIRYRDKPLVLIYRPIDLASELGSTTVIRNLFDEEIHLLGVNTTPVDWNRHNPTTWGLDGIVEFPPHLVSIPYSRPLPGLSKDFRGTIYDYSKAARTLCYMSSPLYKLYKGIIPDWDNTPRYHTDPHIYFQGSPAKYKAWLEVIADITAATLDREEQFVFINAWNEWGEGAYLEPDERYGKAYLEATLLALGK